MDTSQQPVESPDPTDVPRESPRTILVQFVLFPLGVVLVGVAVFLLFGVLASEDHSIPEYVQEIRSGSSHGRWQAAYQLSKSLKRGEASRYPDLSQDIAAIYVNARDDDPKIRRYLSMVLGTLGDKRSTAVLIDGLKDPDPETKIYALWALGEIKDPRAVDAISAQAMSPEADIRKTAVYALGQIGDARAVPALVAALNDQTPDVRWNAALSLSRFRDSRALGPVREMLDRKRLDGIVNFREDQKEDVMISAMSAYARLAGAEARGELDGIARSDRSLRVRGAAKEVLAQLP